MITSVLDASALLALLRNEPGAKIVAAQIFGCGMSVVNLGEVITVLARSGLPEKAIHAAIDPLPITFVPPDVALAYSAGMLQPLTRSLGLSFGDRICLALARHLAVPALTTDQAWQTIAATVGVTVVLIR